MPNIPQEDEILNYTREFLDKQGYSSDSEPEDKLDKIFEILAASRNTASALYGWEPPQGKGLPRKLKNFVQLKLKNIILNTLEKYVMRQQKYNEVVYQALLELKKERDDRLN